MKVLQVVEIIFAKDFKGVTLKSFQNGNEAWQELSRRDPDLLITDDHMANVAGRDIVRSLMEKKVNYPIIVTSGWSPTPEWVLECKKHYSSISFLSIPWSVEEFLKELSSHLGPKLQFQKNVS